MGTFFIRSRNINCVREITSTVDNTECYLSCMSSKGKYHKHYDKCLVSSTDTRPNIYSKFLEQL
jgi:hypothetical protein